MKPILIFTIIVGQLIILPVALAQQLYVLTSGCPSNYSCGSDLVLHRINEAESTVEKIRMIVAGHQKVFVNHDMRILVAVDLYMGGKTVKVVDMEHPLTEISHNLRFGDLRKASWIDYPPHMKIKIDERVRKTPQDSDLKLGPVLAKGLVEDGGLRLYMTAHATRGILDFSIPLDHIYPPWYPQLKFHEHPRPRIVQSVIGGQYGVPQTDSDFQGADAYQNEMTNFDGAKNLSVGIPLPPQSMGKARYARLWILARSSKHAVVFDQDDPASSLEGDGSIRLNVWNFQSTKWSAFTIPGGWPSTKMMGSWIAGEAICKSCKRVSPGANERTALTGKPGRIEREGEFNGNGGSYYPGILYLINLDNGKQYEIRTEQGDSEILLVQDKTVYYRVNEDLFRAPIEYEGVGAAVKIASGVEIRESHWAFLSER